MTAGNTDVIAEQVRSITMSIGKMEAQLEAVSQSMTQFIEFRKEAEFLNQKLAKLEGSRNHQIEEIKDLQLKVNSQQTLNRILQFIFGLVSTAGLSLALFIAGGNRTSDMQINNLESDMRLIKYQIASKINQPSVQVNTNEEKVKD